MSSLRQQALDRQQCNLNLQDYLYIWLAENNFEYTDDKFEIVNQYITSKLKKNKSCLTDDDDLKNKLLERIKNYTHTELRKYISEPTEETKVKLLSKTNKYFIEYAKNYIEKIVPVKITHYVFFEYIKTLKMLEESINNYFGIKKYDYKKIMKDIVRKQEADYEKDKTLEFMNENTLKNYCKTEEGKKYASLLEIIIPKKNDGKRKSKLLKRKSLKRNSLKRKSLKRKSLKRKSLKRKSKRNKKY